MTKYLVDSSVMVALANTKDVFHSTAKEFFTNHSSDDLGFPILALFEFHAVRNSRIKAPSEKWAGLPGTYMLKNKHFINVDRVLFDSCQRDGLFDLFSGLKGADLIFACIAKLGDYTLVTSDNGFDQHKNHIKILKIPTGTEN